MGEIELTEWGRAKSAFLTSEELRALIVFQDQLRISEGKRGATLIGPRPGYVGIAKLSDRTQVVVKPKVPVRELLDLIGLAFRGKSLPATVGMASYEESNPNDWIPFLLAAELERLFRVGLRRGYVDTVENLACVRGRIKFARLFTTAVGLLPCEFDDFTIDTAENRFLRSVVELMLSARLSPEIRLRLARASDFLGDVQLVNAGTVGVPDLRGNPLMHYYQPAMELCKLYLLNAGIELKAGAIAAPGFFVPMHDVFERAIINTLAETLPHTIVHHRVFTEKILHESGEPAYPVALIPDGIILDRSRALVARDGRVLLVIDAKYKDPTRLYNGRTTFRNSDMYQILTYARALDCPGLLVYPKVDQDVAVSYRMGDTAFRMMTVDLSEQNLGGLSVLAATVMQMTKLAA